MKPTFSKRRNQQRGNALIEAGLIAPVMFLMLSGVIDVGRAFYFTDAAASAARAGAQYGVQSASNFNNVVAMEVAALNDANASCTDSSGTAVTCDISTCKTCAHFADAGKTAYTGPYKV